MASPRDVSLCLPFLFSLLALLHGTNASVVRDWCPTKEAFLGSNNTLMGLEGKTIKCGASIWPPFSIFNESSGEWSGYDIEVFREVARRGRFDVEIVQLQSPAENETWEDVLNTQGREMDTMCTWWGETISRKRRGFAFSYPILDQSLVLATPIPRRVERSFAQQFWVFLQPFSRDLWLCLLFGNLFTAIVVFILDPHINLDPWTNAKGQRRMSETYYPTSGGVLAWCKYALINISGFFYQGWVLGTVQDPYKHPRNLWMKIYLMSWTGVLIVLIAAYTAQLTSFLIIDSRPVDSIDSMDDVTSSGLPVCAADGIPHVSNFFLNSAPTVPVVSIPTVDEAFPGIRQEECAAAVAGKGELQLLLAGNEECDMRIVGRTLKDINGAFPGDTSNCGSFIVHVVGGLVQEIAQDGLLEDMWSTYITKPAKCAWAQYKPKSKEEQKNQLQLKAMGGLFIIHAAFAFLALVGFLVQKFLQRKKMLPKNESFVDDSQAGPWQKLAGSFKNLSSPSIQLDGKQLTKGMPSFGRLSSSSKIGDSDCDLPNGASTGPSFSGGGKNFADMLRGGQDEHSQHVRPSVPSLDLGFAKDKVSPEDRLKIPTPAPPESSPFARASDPSPLARGGSCPQVPLKSSMAKRPDDASTPRLAKQAAIVTPHESTTPDAAQQALQARLEQRGSAMAPGSPRSGLEASPPVTARNIVVGTDDLIKLQDRMSRAHSFSSLAANGPPKHLGSSGGSQELGQASSQDLSGIELGKVTRSRLSTASLVDLVPATEQQQQQQLETAPVFSPRASAALGLNPEEFPAALRSAEGGADEAAGQGPPPTMQSVQPPLTDRSAPALSAPQISVLPRPFLTPRPGTSVYAEPRDNTEQAAPHAKQQKLFAPDVGQQQTLFKDEADIVKPFKLEEGDKESLTE